MEISFVYLELHRLAYYTFESPGLSKLFEKPGFQCGEFEPEGLKVYYIQGNTIPKGKVLEYPNTNNHKVVIIQSGNKKTNKQVWEKRNITEDFRNLFDLLHQT